MNFKRHSLSTLVANLKTVFQRHSAWSVFAFLGIVIVILYFPALTAYFISDDFGFLSYLHFYTRDLLNGQRWGEWLLGGIQGAVFFRPLANAFWVLHYIAFNLDPVGYHSVSMLFHLLASYVVFLLVTLLTRHRSAASVSALVFAAMPVHAEPVGWIAAIYDPIGGLFFFLSVLFFVLYLRQHLPKWYLMAFGAFMAALCSKEIALTLPGVIILYDVMFHGLAPLRLGERIKRHAPFWIMIAVRILAFGHGNTGLRLDERNGWNWLDGILIRVANPLIVEPNAVMQLGVLVGVIFLVWVYRSRREVLFGVLWIPITFFPTIVGEVSDRSFYISSFGLALVLASILTRPPFYPRRWWSVVAAAGVIGLIVIYSAALITTNQTMRKAGDVAETILKQIVKLHPSASPDERLVFVGVPDRIPEGPLVFLTGFPGLLHPWYGSREIQALKFNKFPMWLDNLDKVFFFEVDHRRVAERTDLVQRLKERTQCENYSAPFQQWNFATSPLDWESWNQLVDFAIRDHAWSMRAVGDDPILASPPFELSTLAIGEIQITMRVRAKQPTLRGEVYWLTTSQSDFSPGLKLTFPVLADGDWHTYRVDMARSGMLLLGDHITQLRLDPTDAPAEIAIQSISISTHCSSWQNERCVCTPP